MHVEGAVEQVISHPDDIMNALVAGEKRRSVGATDMNARSSRSHTIFRIIIESRPMD
ncbi:hypothetical protein EON66_09460, partial [archaeon]